MNLRKHTADISDGLILASRSVLEVGDGGPVGRLVLGRTTRGAVGSNEGSIVGGLAKAYRCSSVLSLLQPCQKLGCQLTARAEDLVDVISSDSWVDQRVDTSLSTDAAALHAPEGRGLAAEEGDRSSEGEELLGVHIDVFALNARLL